MILRSLFASIALVVSLSPARAQEEDEPPFQLLAPAPVIPEADPDRSADETFLGRTIVVAPTRERVALEVPWSVDALPDELLRRRAYRTTPQALRDQPGVMVQETALGQGSPYIRGFTGFHNVLLIDGVRLNNSVFRSGPNQYWNTVDPYSIERLELLRGPSSVLHGSDAIGGVVQALTRDPYGYGGADGLLYYRFASAERSHVARAEGTAALGGASGLLLGWTGKSYGDLRGGDDVGTQENTGYDEYDADLKLEHFLGDDTRLVLLYQHVQQNDVPRTHRTVFAEPFEGTTVGSDLRRDLDQERDLAYAQLHGEDAGAVDAWRAGVSWQRQEEERDRIRGSGERELQGFEVDALGLFANAEVPSRFGRFTFGFDAYRDHVDSFSSAQPIQGPVADDATYDLFGVFAQDEIELGERTTLVPGARWSFAAADADDVLDPEGGGQISLDDEWSELVGSLRFVHRWVADRVHLFGGVTQGFRAPNLSDLTRFDIARTDELEVPSPGLDPEEYVGYELGVKTRAEELSTRVSVFYTDIQDGIVRFPTGETTPEGDVVVTKANVGDGHVVGLEGALAWEVRPQWTVWSTGTWLDGEQENFPAAGAPAEDEPLSRLMPPTVQLGLTWAEQDGGRWAELQTVWADDADELSTRDEGDTSRIPPGGTPSYFLLHLRGGWRPSKHLAIDLALENVFDETYRVHGSGITAPGRSLIVGLSFVPHTDRRSP